MTNFLIGSINVAGPWFHSSGEGVTTCTLDEATGTISRVASFPAIENAIWMTKTADRVFVATERFMDGGEIGAFDPCLARVGAAQKTPGGAICHLAVLPDRKSLCAVNYHGGVTVHTLDGLCGGASPDAQGSCASETRLHTAGVRPAHQTIAYDGSGPNQERQEKSHPHQAVVSPDGTHLFVCDLGCDRVWVHAIQGNRLGLAQGIVAPIGSGPRHLVFHPRLPLFYLVGELDAMVHTYEGQGTHWRAVDAISALPAGFNGTPGGAAIKFHPSDKSLAVSLRGSDTIAVFRVGERGELSLAANFSTQGKTPRDFAFAPSGRWLIALNQDSDSGVAFEFDSASGLPTGRVGASFAIGCPVCAIF